MHLFGFSSIVFTILALIAAQTKDPGSSKPTRHDSVEVVAKLSPEEVENQKLEDVYEPISAQERKGNCSTEIVGRYKSEVIPLAEKSSFNVPKNKFLFLAHQDIGNCYLALQKFVEAETSFKKALQYAPVWPGVNDSDYPIDFRQIGTAQMGQERWEAAEESFQKSVSIFDSQIDQVMKSDAERAASLRGSKALTMAYLGIAYLRQGRTADAMKTVDSAFGEVKQPDVPARFAKRVVELGRLIAQGTGDNDAIAKWSQRN